MVERIQHIYAANGANRCSRAAFSAILSEWQGKAGERGLPQRFLYGKTRDIHRLCMASEAGETDRDGLYFQPMVQCTQIRNSGHLFEKYGFARTFYAKYNGISNMQ